MFVQPTKGYVEPSEVVTIPHGSKDRILKYLDQAHGVSAATIYNDLHGFIRYHGTHASAYAAFYEGLVRWNEGNYDAAIDSFSKSIDLNRRHPAPLLGRGAAYDRKGAHDLAIQDYDSAIELNPAPQKPMPIAAPRIVTKAIMIAPYRTVTGQFSWTHA